LSQEVHKAKSDGAGVVIQMDGNLWAGKKIIQDDPKPQNQNGKYFENFLCQNPDLTVTNALPMCEGKVTRVKHTKKETQESILDFFLVCDKILPHVTKIIIDEKDELALTKYKRKVVKTDHRMLKLELNFKVHTDVKPERVETFNLRNKKKQAIFKDFTSKDERFSKCFMSVEESVEIQFKRWKRLFDKSIHACFSKIRIKEDKKKSKIDELMDLKRSLIKKRKQNESENEIVELENEISEEVAKKEYEKIEKVIGNMDEEPNINMWSELRKAFPKKGQPLPTGVMNVKGKVITNPEEKKQVTQKHFQNRMRKRTVMKEVKENIDLNEKVFKMRVNEATQLKSPDFNMDELESVFKSLKSGKSRDPENYVNELFTENVMGSDLKKSILLMMNKIKQQMNVPEVLRTASITIIHKRKCKLDLNNWRGIFVTSAIRGILMKLVYGRTYQTVNKNMSDAQIGARKGKSVRNHLFVLNSIISDVKSSKNKEPIDLSIMDYKQMFDTEQLPAVLNSFYEAGVKDDMLALLNEANRNVMFAVKTPNGKTEQGTIENKVMQGDVMSPLMSANFVDRSLVKPTVEAGHIYMYKGKVKIPPLIMQDDTLTVSVCGEKTKNMNNMINTCTNLMGLQFGNDKCVQMHIGKKHSEGKCKKGEVDAWTEDVSIDETGKTETKDKHVGKVEMKSVSEKKYLGEIISKDATNKTNIKSKTNKALGNVKQIISGLNERPYGKYTFQAGKLMRGGILISSLLNNSETWINLTKSDIEKIEKPDKIFHDKLLGKGSKVFKHLELGTLPLKFVILKKRLKFLKYILDEQEDTMIRQVFDTLKTESKKGDFVDLVTKDMKEINLKVTYEEIKTCTKRKWNELVNIKTEEKGFKTLVEENKTKEKTKHISFERLQMSDYLQKNSSSKLSKEIFQIRSGTFDVKTLRKWDYNDNLCVACQLKEENMGHFMTCEAYGRKPKADWENIYGNRCENKEMVLIAQEATARKKLRKKLLEDGQASTSGSQGSILC